MCIGLLVYIGIYTQYIPFISISARKKRNVFISLLFDNPFHLILTITWFFSVAYELDTTFLFWSDYWTMTTNYIMTWWAHFNLFTEWFNLETERVTSTGITPNYSFQMLSLILFPRHLQFCIEWLILVSIFFLYISSECFEIGLAF